MCTNLKIKKGDLCLIFKGGKYQKILKIVKKINKKYYLY